MAGRHRQAVQNGEVTVVWKPEVCIHSTICFRGLPAVFDPRRRPWVDVQAASTAEIVAQVEVPVGGAVAGANAPAEAGAAPAPPPWP